MLTIAPILDNIIIILVLVIVLIIGSADKVLPETGNCLTK